VNASKLLPDSAGIVAATLCAAHCVALPMLATSAGLAALARLEHLERPLFVSTVLIAATVFGRSFSVHRSALPLVVGALGLALLLARGESEGIVETVLSLSGGGCLVLAHVLNLRRLQARTKPAHTSP
jgi:hypothetical protein